MLEMILRDGSRSQGSGRRHRWPTRSHKVPIHNTLFQTTVQYLSHTKQGGRAQQHTATMLHISTCTLDRETMWHFMASVVIWMSMAQSTAVSSHFTVPNTENTALHLITTINDQLDFTSFGSLLLYRFSKLSLRCTIPGSHSLYCNRIQNKHILVLSEIWTCKWPKVMQSHRSA